MKHKNILITLFLTGILATLASAEILYQATFETQDDAEGWRDTGDGSTVFQTPDFGGANGSTGALAVQVRDGWLWFAQTQSDVGEPNYNADLHNAIDTIYGGDPSQYQLSFDMLHNVDEMATKMPNELKFHVSMNGPDGWKQYDGADEYIILGQKIIDSKGAEWITVSFNMGLFPGITPGGAWIQPNIGLYSDWGADSYFLVDNIRFETAEAPGYEDPDAVATVWAETFDSDIAGFAAENDGATLTADSGMVNVSVRDGWLWFGKYTMDPDMDTALSTALADPGKYQVRYDVSSATPMMAPSELRFHYAIWNVEKEQWMQYEDKDLSFGTAILASGGEAVTVAMPATNYSLVSTPTGVPDPLSMWTICASWKLTHGDPGRRPVITSTPPRGWAGSTLPMATGYGATPLAATSTYRKPISPNPELGPTSRPTKAIRPFLTL
jgi:hypothetical protein